MGRNNIVSFFVFLLAVFAALPVYFVASAFLIRGLVASGEVVWYIQPVGLGLWNVYLFLHWVFVVSLFAAQLRHASTDITTAERINMAINPHRYMYLKNRSTSCWHHCRYFFSSPFRPMHADTEYGKSTLDAF